jgi:hypothetical protein
VSGASRSPATRASDAWRIVFASRWRSLQADVVAPGGQVLEHEAAVRVGLAEPRCVDD